MDNLDLTQIIVIIIGILGVVITSFVIPYLKTKLDTASYEKIIAFTKTGVKAAEQLYGSSAGVEKRAYVEKYLADHNIKYDRSVLEAAVNEHFGEGSLFKELLGDSTLVTSHEAPSELDR